MRIEGDPRHAIAFDSRFYDPSKIPRYGPIVDPVRNPFAPGAGQRPPELAGRDRELDAFEIVLERVARGRPERSLVLTGLRGVGKTVLLGELRSHGRPGGLGRRQDRGAARGRPAPPALGRAAPRHPRSRRPPLATPDRVDDVLGVLKAFALRSSPDGAKLRDRWQPGIDVARPRPAGPTPATSRSTWSSCSPRSRRWPSDVESRRRDPHRRDAGPAPGRRVGAVRGLPRAVAVAGAAGRRRRRPAAPARGALGVEVVLRAALPLRAHRPARPRRRRLRPAAPRPSARTPRSTPTPWTRSTPRPAATPTSSRPTARRAGTPRCAPRSPRSTSRWPRPKPRRSWPSASSAPASSAPPRPSASTCGRWPSSPRAGTNRSAPRASPITCSGGPSSLSPARDSLMKKGLVFSAQRGTDRLHRAPLRPVPPRPGVIR